MEALTFSQLGFKKPGLHHSAPDWCKYRSMQGYTEPALAHVVHTLVSHHLPGLLRPLPLKSRAVRVVL